MRHDAITAPIVVDGAMNGTNFRAYVEQMLAPTLKAGDNVMIHSLRSHTVSCVREAIEATGASLLYLLPYSSDPKPIEQVFTKFVAVLRAEAARSVEAFWSAIGRLLDNFSKDECASHLSNCGYIQSA